MNMYLAEAKNEPFRDRRETGAIYPDEASSAAVW